MKTLIIEPHPDDILLSMHGTLCSDMREHLGEIYVLTVSGDNGRDSKKYCEHIGANLVQSQPLDDINFGKNKLDHVAVRTSANPWFMQRSYYCTQFSDELFKVFKLIKGVTFDLNVDVVIGPVGILHPLHVVVSSVIDGLDDQLVKMFYADTPYQFRVYGRKTLEDILAHGFDMSWEFKPGEDDVKEKMKLFRRFYPTESVHWDEPKFINFSEQLFMEDS